MEQFVRKKVQGNNVWFFFSLKWYHLWRLIPTSRLPPKKSLNIYDLNVHCLLSPSALLALTTSCRLTCIHAKLFPTVKRRTCIHVLRHYSRNSYSNFGRHAIFLESSGSRLGDPGQKALQTTIEPTLFVDFCQIPLSNTCFFVRPARNVNREIFLHCQKYFSIVTWAFVLVSLAVWSTRLCWIIGRCVSTSDGPDLLQKTGTAQNLAIENSKCQWENAFILVSLHSFFDMRNN